MSTTHSRMLAAAADNARLLRTLSETDYAIAALQQNDSYISALKKETAEGEKRLQETSRKVGKEFNEHKRYRDSHMRRLAYKLGGKKEKFEAEASKEEREWLEAVQEELRVKQALEHLRTNLADATKTHAELTAVASVHNSAQTELDALYASIFDGPTPDIPGEDQKESAVRYAGERFNDTQFTFSTEVQARTILIDANKFLDLARLNIEDALSASTADIWGVGGSFADMAKSSALSKAEGNVHQAQMAINQAARFQPAVRSIGNLDIPEMHFMTDMVFDNIFSDLNARDRIKHSQALLAQAKQNMVGELQAADRRVEGVMAALDMARRDLEGKRAELQRTRAAAFDRVTKGESVTPASASNPWSSEFVSGMTEEGVEAPYGTSHH